jgi:hypothetical protein
MLITNVYILAAAISPELGRNFALATWWALLGLAVVVFINIQRYLFDPERKRLNAEWFEKFAAYQRSRYQSNGMGWRARDIREHFAPGEVEEKSQPAAGSSSEHIRLMYYMPV